MIKMGEPKTEWLLEYASKLRTQQKYRVNFDDFCEFANTTDEDLVKEYKTMDKDEFSKKWGKVVIQWYNKLLKEGKSTNTARGMTNAPRSFFRSQCCTVKIRRGAIATAQPAYGQHEFTLDELRNMWNVGNLEDKARLSCGLSLGYGAELFLSLKWDFIEPYLSEELEAPIGFLKERKKERQPIRSHLTHEAIQCLREKRRLEPDNIYLWQSNGNKAITPEALNAWLRSLAERAKVKSRGKIVFHLLRKVLFSALVNSGMSEINAKICIGKSSGVSVETYLYPILRKGFVDAHRFFNLTGFSNSNHGLLKAQREELAELRGVMKVLAKYIVIEQQNKVSVDMMKPIATHEGLEIGSTLSEEDIETLLQFIAPKEKEKPKEGE